MSPISRTRCVAPQPNLLVSKVVIERLPGSRQVSIITIKYRVQKLNENTSKPYYIIIQYLKYPIYDCLYMPKTTSKVHNYSFQNPLSTSQDPRYHSLTSYLTLLMKT